VATPAAGTASAAARARRPQVLDQLAIGEGVDWVGNAWGGHVGLRFAAAANLVPLEAPTSTAALIGEFWTQGVT
jgi:pimeloyl-ACP methyl ester carboxylesterase